MYIYIYIYMFMYLLPRGGRGGPEGRITRPDAWRWLGSVCDLVRSSLRLTCDVFVDCPCQRQSQYWFGGSS